jgi:hypothetical protein
VPNPQDSDIGDLPHPQNSDRAPLDPPEGLPKCMCRKKNVFWKSSGIFWQFSSKMLDRLLPKPIQVTLKELGIDRAPDSWTLQNRRTGISVQLWFSKTSKIPQTCMQGEGRSRTSKQVHGPQVQGQHTIATQTSKHKTPSTRKRNQRRKQAHISHLQQKTRPSWSSTASALPLIQHRD